MFALNFTESEVLTFFWVNYGFIMLSIIMWVFNILMWIIYILKRLVVIKRNIASMQNDSEKMKELTVQLTKFRLLLLTSCCEMCALVIGGVTICIHRILYFYGNDLIVEIGLSYIHDFLNLMCLYLVLVVLKLLNILTRYFIGVYNWHEYKPDGIEKEIKYIILEAFIVILMAGVWVTTVPLGIILFIRTLCEYLKHVIWSKKLYLSLKSVSTESRLNLSNEGKYQYRLCKREEKRYKRLATWIIIGLFFWILATGMSLLGMLLNQVRILLTLQHNSLAIFNEIISNKIYLICITDVLIIIGGAILFPLHLYYTIKHLSKKRFPVSSWCYRPWRTERQTRLREPLIIA